MYTVGKQGLLGDHVKILESVCSALVLCHTAIERNSGSSGRSSKYIEKRV